MIIEELYTKLGFKVDEAGLNKGKKAMEGFKASATKLLGGLAVGAGLMTLAKTGVEAAMQMENLSAQFKVMTGSATGAKQVLDDIAQFAAKTPFDKIGLADAAKTLMAFGLASEDVVPTLRMLGDVAGPSAERLKSLALVFGQIKSAGKLQGQDLLQLINQGFNPLQIISEKTGRSMAELKDAMSKGAISAEMVTMAFQAATSEGGLFFGNLEEQSQTLAGRISTLKDNVVTALQNMAEAFLPLMKSAVETMIAFDWAPVVATIQGMVPLITSLAEGLGTLVKWTNTLKPILLIIFGPAILARIMAMVAGTRAYAAAQLFVQRASLAAGAANNYHLTTMGLLKAAYFSTGTAAKTMAKGVAASMRTIAGATLGAIGVAWMLYDALKAAEQKDLDRLAAKFEEMDIQDFSEGGGTWGMYGATAEERVEGVKGMLATAKQKMVQARKSGDKAALEKAAKDVAFFSKLSQEAEGLYYRARGVHYEEVAGSPVAAGRVDPKSLSKALDLELEKSLKELDKSTKKQTKATQDNTAALKEKPFNIADLARQSFDAQFNVKLKNMIIGAST